MGVYGEVKRTNTTLDDLAVSTDQNDQIGRYLSQTGVVLLCNVRGIGLLTCDPSFQREPGKPVPPKKRILEKTVDLWGGGKRPSRRSIRPRSRTSSPSSRAPSPISRASAHPLILQNFCAPGTRCEGGDAG